MNSVSIEVDNVVKAYGRVTVISGLSLAIEPGEFFTLLGPSGCGKTTLLRMIAGFNTIESGSIYFNKKRINDLDPADRHIGMVFQDYAIFPHLTAQKNVEFGIKNAPTVKKVVSGRTATRDRAMDYLDFVKMKEWSDRRPDQLSGGQQQRIALARALATSPDVLLMDEPLSNLDAKLRIEMRETIREIQRSVGITTVYVTHDQEEAMAVSDRIAVMKDGVIQQVGKPEDLYLRPVNLFVASFIGANNILRAEITGSGSGRTLLVQGVSYPLDDAAVPADMSGEVAVSIRPEHLHLEEESGQGLRGAVVARTFLGRDTHNTVALADGTTVDVVRQSDHDDHHVEGATVNLRLDTKYANFFPPADVPPSSEQIAAPADAGAAS